MCGISGIWSPADADATEATRLMFFSLYALQHRGQESAGIAATDGRDLRVVRRMGLVGQVFSEPDLAILGGRAAIGHTRYSTTGSSRIQNAQPLVVSTDLGELAIGHNGNCINARDLRDDLVAQGARFATSSDTEVIAQALLPRAPTPDVTVVGVLGDVRNAGLRNVTLPGVFVPYTLIAPPSRVLAVRPRRSDLHRE